MTWRDKFVYCVGCCKICGRSELLEREEEIGHSPYTFPVKATYLLLPTTPQRSALNFVSLEVGAVRSSEKMDRTPYPTRYNNR